MVNKWLPAGIVALLAVGGVALALNNHPAKQPTTSNQVDGKIVALGSTALQVLVDQAGKNFTEQNPKVSITVQGGGSGAGLTAAANGTAQIGMSDIYAEETKGIDASQVKGYPVAVVGIAPIVNPDVGVDNLSLTQLQDIFAGEVTNWQQVGGKDEKITIINREDDSGTRHVFTKQALNGTEPIKGLVQSSGGTMVAAVGTTPGAIGYVAFSNLKNSVKTLNIDGVKATSDNVTDNSWKIWAYELIYTHGEATGATKSFIDYLLSDTVQKSTVKQTGFFPLSAMKVSKAMNGEVTKR